MIVKQKVSAILSKLDAANGSTTFHSVVYIYTSSMLFVNFLMCQDAWITGCSEDTVRSVKCKQRFFFVIFNPAAGI